MLRGACAWNQETPSHSGSWMWTMTSRASVSYAATLPSPRKHRLRELKARFAGLEVEPKASCMEGNCFADEQVRGSSLERSKTRKKNPSVVISPLSPMNTTVSDLSNSPCAENEGHFYSGTYWSFSTTFSVFHRNKPICPLKIYKKLPCKQLSRQNKLMFI